MANAHFETKQLPARLVPVRGDGLEVVFFLRTVDHQGMRLEHLGERLNREHLRFIPIGVGDAIELFQLDRIAYIEYEGLLPEIEELRAVGADRERVVFYLINGERLEGDLVFVMPPDCHRVSDVMNVSEDKLLLLVAEHHCFYVRRTAVMRVQD